MSNEESKPRLLLRIAQTTAAFSSLKVIWKEKNTSLASIISFTFLYDCESWPRVADLTGKKNPNPYCYRSMFRYFS